MTLETTQCLRDPRPHLRAACNQPADANETVQVPLLLHLIKTLQLNDAHNLTEDLTLGFSMMGRCAPATTGTRATISDHSTTTNAEFQLQNRHTIPRCLPPTTNRTPTLTNQKHITNIKQVKTEGAHRGTS